MCSRVVCFALFFTIFSCKNDAPPEPPKPATITLKSEDASCTEAWLKATTTETPVTVRLLRDGQSVAVLGLRSSDSLLIDEGLLPRRAYTYQLQKLNGDSSVAETSANVQVTTMDTTSHNFTWQVDTIGRTSSVLFDVGLVDDTLAYAVGEVSVFQDSLDYGLVVWNGSRWRLQRLLATGPTGVISNLRPRGVFAFSKVDVWFASGGVFHWDGQNITPYWLNAFSGNPNPIFDPGQSAQRLCGISSTNLYTVGTQGAIAYFNGVQWQRMDAGTSVDLLDVWKSRNESGTWACGYRPSYSESILLRYNGTAWDQYGHSPPWGIYADLFGSAWFYKNDSAYVVGNQGVFRHAQSSATGYRRIPIDLGYFPFKIRGAGRNDIAIVGENAMIWHFNGLTWKRFDQLIDSDARLYSVAVGYNQIIAVGYGYYNAIERHAVIYRGRR